MRWRSGAAIVFASALCLPLIASSLLASGWAVPDYAARTRGPRTDQAWQPLEFWPQRFVRDNTLLHMLTLPLIADKRLKRFKGLYFLKLGEGMDMAEVDRLMLAAFRRYDLRRDRAQLYTQLDQLELLLQAYEPPPYRESQFVYVAMGASISQGAGANPASRGWVYLVADRLRTRRPNVRVRNLAVGGTTTEQALQVQLPAAIGCRPDLITYTAGMNDLQYGIALEQVRLNVERTLAELRAKTDARIVMTLMPPGQLFAAFWLHLPKLRSRRRNVTGARIAQFNALFRTLAAEYRIKLVDMGQMFRAPSGQQEIDTLFSFDGIHPNNRGLALIADLFRAGIKEVLPPPRASGRRVR